MNNHNKVSQKTAYLMLFMAAFFWACVSIIIKAFMTDVPPLHFMFARFFIAFVIFFIFAHRSVKLNRYKVLHGSVVGVFLFFAYYFSIVSLGYTAASKAGFFFALSVLWVPIAQIFIKKKLPSIWVIISVFLSLVGLVLISGLDGGGLNYGDVIAIGSSLAYTGYILYINRYIKDMHENELTLIILAVVSIISFVSGVITEGVQPQIITQNILPILFTAFLSTFLSTYFQAKAQQVASPEAVGIILLGEPICTFIMAVTILHESVTISGVFGAGILIVSLIIAVLKDV